MQIILLRQQVYIFNDVIGVEIDNYQWKELFLDFFQKRAIKVLVPPNMNFIFILVMKTNKMIVTNIDTWFIYIRNV